MQKETFLTLEGKRFHFFWLRDNCLCPECRHPSSFQKLSDISDRTHITVECDRPYLKEPLSVDLDEAELSITWNEDPPHRSTFPVSWLLLHAYDREPSTPLRQEILWDKTWIDAHPPQAHEIDSCEPESWVSDLFSLGFALLQNVTDETFESLLSSVGPIHYTEYGRFASVKAIVGANDLADTGHALHPHTDYSTYMHLPPLLQFLYCVENEAKGGETFVKDAFRIAKDFRQDHPDYFRILVETPIQFQQFYSDWRYFFRRTRPMLELDEWGEVSGVYFGHSKCWNWELPFDKMEQFYEAYTTFYTYVKHPAYEYSIRLQPGDCLIMHNSRVFHGRNAFDSMSGNRHLRTAYVAWDYLLARSNFLKFKHLYLGK